MFIYSLILIHTYPSCVFFECHIAFFLWRSRNISRRIWYGATLEFDQSQKPISFLLLLLNGPAWVLQWQKFCYLLMIFLPKQQEGLWGFSTLDDTDTWRLVILWKHPVTINASLWAKHICIYIFYWMVWSVQVVKSRKESTIFFPFDYLSLKHSVSSTVQT